MRLDFDFMPWLNYLLFISPTDSAKRDLLLDVECK